ncbi:hypothetical protein [Streptomyces sp. NPDC008125]|uniref:hypothetical protein n=1 Tax=Streptomyces sp. NPDC008125 TaxID=3364811 RepID=UPI0036E26B4E
MTYGSSTNSERTDGERTDGAPDSRRTDDRTRTAVTAPPSTGAGSAAGPKPVHAPRTADSPDRDLTADHADRMAERSRTATADTDRATTDRTGTPGAERDADRATPADRTDSADGVERPDRTDRVERPDRTDRVERPDRTDRAGAHRETRSTGATSGASATSRTSPSAVNGLDHDGALLGGTDRDELERRMRHAVSDFVEDPRRAVREAGETLDTVTQNLVKALTERSTALRSEEGAEGAGGQNGERTEQLRIVLQHYRDLTDRLLAV